MNVNKIIEALGGRKAVIEMTELTKGRISQWVTAEDIPAPWLKFFEAKFPELDWPMLRGKVAERRARGDRRKAQRRKESRITG